MAWKFVFLSAGGVQNRESKKNVEAKNVKICKYTIIQLEKMNKKLEKIGEKGIFMHN